MCIVGWRVLLLQRAERLGCGERTPEFTNNGESNEKS